MLHFWTQCRTKRFLLWSYVIHIFPNRKTFDELVFAQLRQYSSQVLIESCTTTSGDI